MKIGVLIKRVPDTASQVRVTPDGSGIEVEGVKYVMNPYDEYAVEEALATREKLGGDSAVTAVSLGPPDTVEIIRIALAMGADRGIHVLDDRFQGQDSMADAAVLASVIKGRGFDLVFAGKQGIDMDSAQTPSAIAEELGWPQIYVAVEFSIADDGGSARVRRRFEGWDEIVETGFPCVVTCEKGLNDPRYASLPGIMKAKSKPLEVLDLESTGVDPDRVGAENSRTHVKEFMPLPARGAVKMIEGAPAEQAAALVRALREEAKVV